MLHLFLQQRLQETVAGLLPDVSVEAILVRPCPDPKFGD